MTETEENLMMSSIRKFKQERKPAEIVPCPTQASCQVETALATFRRSIIELRLSLETLEAEFEARAAAVVGYGPAKDMNAILGAVASAWGIPARDLMRHEQTLTLVVPRQVAMLMMYQAGNSKKSIGRFFGMHHTTVIHSLNVAPYKIATNADIAAKVGAAGWVEEPVN